MSGCSLSCYILHFLINSYSHLQILQEAATPVISSALISPLSSVKKSGVGHLSSAPKEAGLCRTPARKSDP